MAYNVQAAMTQGLPVDYVVSFVPETGAKRPYELWYVWASGKRQVRGSFKTQQAAEKSRDECVAYAIKRGWWRDE